ncbi:MAG TPA: zf-HC2 domain-containing protein, partial [Thermoanaerobaculia bacterium]|nr:zf-HC2 domain-containing protein [Thermoanaerobaculia bacterium]
WRADGPPSGPGSPCERVRDRIDPYLDDDLAQVETAGVEAHLEGCPDCRSELAAARSLRAALREGLPMLSCPPEVSAEVLRVAREEARAGRPAGDTPALRLAERLRRLFAAGALRPALAAAAVVALLVAAPLLYRAVTGPEPGRTGAEVATGGEADYSPEEIARAEEEARLVLAYVASVGRDAGRTVQEEVFADGIGRPARRMLDGLEAAGLGIAPATSGPGAGEAAGTERREP